MPHVLLPQVVRRVVEPGRSGVYVLGRDERGFKPGYVGRSDTDLQRRLATHNHRDEFEYFIFRYAGSPEEAFRLECELWHAHEETASGMLNRIHPDAPSGSGLECPYCAFGKDLAALLRHVS
ncbi:hypothetical protein [Deinococcus yavapaiensis]|uniref:hypothetical protein n=1 Tax=Deinococcus yavapaiensis TaxID=309889 RepID=UPI0014734932|nr:hypothetical protein [Deinococcus yavapaiensis]